MKNRWSVVLLVALLMGSSAYGQRRVPRHPPVADSPPVLELLSEPVVVALDESVYVGPFSTTGARLAGLRLHVSEYSGERCFVSGAFEWRFKRSDAFLGQTRYDFRLPPQTPGNITRFPIAYVFLRDGEPDAVVPVFLYPQGPEGRVRLYVDSDCVATVDSVQVWLER